MDHLLPTDLAELAARVIEASYWTEHTYHAQLEPMNCIARVAADGQSAEIWIGTQAPVLAAAVAAGVLKTTPDKIKVNQLLLGGGFGRDIQSLPKHHTLGPTCLSQPGHKRNTGFSSTKGRICHQLKSQGLQRIARQNGGGLIPFHMHGGQATPQRIIVHARHVIMYQRISM